MAQRIPISCVDTYSSYDMPSKHPRIAGDISVDVIEGSGSEHEYQTHRQMESKHRKKQVAPIQTTFHCWKLTKAAPKSKDKDAPNWKRAARVQMTLPSDELAAQVKKQCKARSLTDMYESLSTDQRQQVEVLIQEKRRDENNRYASWEIAAVHREVFNNLRTRIREITFIRVILRREDKRTANSVSEVSKTPADMASDISDLNDLSSPPLKQVNTKGDRHLPAYRRGPKTQSKDRRSHEDLIEVLSVPDIFQGLSSVVPSTPPPVPSALLSRHHETWQDGPLHQDVFQTDQNQVSVPLYQPDRWRAQQFSTSQQTQQTQHDSHEQDALAYIAGMKHEVYTGRGGQYQSQQRHTLQSPQAPVHAVDSRPLVTQPVLQTQRQPELQRHQSYPRYSPLSGEQQQDYDVEGKQPYINTQRGGLDKFEAIVVQQPAEQPRRHQIDQSQPRSMHREPWSPEQPLPAPWNFEHSAHTMSTETPSSLEAQPIRKSTGYLGQRIDNPPEVAEPIFITKTSLMSAGAPGADASRYFEGFENRGKSRYKDNEAPVEPDWPSYNPTAEQAHFSVPQLQPQPQPQQQVKDANESTEKLRREDILFWRTQARLSHSRSSSSLDDHSSTLASPEQSTPPTSVSGERTPMHHKKMNRPTYDMPEQFGQQLTAHELLRPNSNRQHEGTPMMAHGREQEDHKPQTGRGVSFEDEKQQLSNRYIPSSNHQATRVQNNYQRPSAPEPPTPQSKYAPQYPLQQYHPLQKDPENTSMLERLNERLDHMELRQAEGATRKAIEAAQKRRELERKEAYERGVEDAMAWTKVRPSGFGGFE